MLCLGLVLPGLALADNVLHPGTPILDRPTLTAIGIQLPITGDDNFNSTVTVRYRKVGAASFSNALPLYHVHPDTTLPYVIAPQFSGSILDLRPATTYEIQLHITDPDGSVDQTLTLTQTTRSIPVDPVTPRFRPVTDAASFQQALDTVQPGDVITLANGFYQGPFSFTSNGTADNPVVLRGASEDGVVLDGAGCWNCNVLEIYGTQVHVERMTIQNGERAIRFQTSGAQGGVVRRVHTRNTTLGLGMKNNSLDFYIADNIMEGMLSWPQVYTDDNGFHSDEDGINVQGFGHVIAHNRLSGFGDAMKTSQNGARAVDFYGNDILWTYDNGVELDGSEGNTRLMRNRFTNTFDTISGQPIQGGPAYIIRNVLYNTVSEQLKLHSHGNPTTEPNGVFAYNNTFVSANYALSLQSPTYVHHIAIENNLFIGPANPIEDMTVDWFTKIDDGLFDYNGYWPDKNYAFNYPSGRLKVFGFAALQQAGMEPHGVLLNTQTLTNGIVGPDDYTILLAPVNLTLAPNSVALDRGLVLPNVTDGFAGSAPDLGALEAGCPIPIYGPRPDGVDESNEVVGCSGATTTPPPPVPQNITVLDGTPQTAIAQNAFLPLRATVTDASGKPLSGITVSFNAPATGASGTFGSSTSLQVTTDSQGIATASPFVANNVPGTYTVTATVAGLSASAAFKLTNTMATVTSVTAPAVVMYSPADQNVQINASVTSGSGVVNAGSIVFRANSVAFATVAVSNGAASANFKVPGATAAGTGFGFTADYVVAGLTNSTSPAKPMLVIKSTAVLSWPQPAAISAGTALGAGQLNATANIPGTFVYTPPAGTVLQVGDGQRLSVTFTPTDTTNYNGASGSITINVSGTVRFALSAVLSRNAAGEIVASVGLANVGNSTATNVVLSAATLNGVAAKTVGAASTVTLAPGASQRYSLTFPPSTNKQVWQSLTLTGTSSSGPFQAQGLAVLF